MVTEGGLVSTADVRPIEEVVKDLREKLVSKLPRDIASWGTVNECARIIHFENLLKEEDFPPYMVWTAHGRIQVASQIIRSLADVYGISNFK